MNIPLNKNRHRTFNVQVGSVAIGGNAPIAVQSMTNTLTQNVNATTDQIMQLYQAGAELVRVSVNTETAAKSVPDIKAKLLKYKCTVPLIGDFHYNGHLLLEKHPDCAQALDKYRVNPGNVDSQDHAFDAILAFAKRYQKPIRIGANSGSVDEKMLEKLNREHPHLTDTELFKEALIQSVLESAARAIELGLKENQIVLSCKVTDVPLLISIYQRLAKACHYALHVGVTESGPGIQGVISSSIGIGALLQQGIGDTIRTSITPSPTQPRTEEVIISRAILQSLNLRHFKPKLITCPGCGRTNKQIFEQLVLDIQKAIDAEINTLQQFPAFHRLKIAIMGCVVNGPGESQHADIGLYLNSQGTSVTVFVKQKKVAVLQGENIPDKFVCFLKKSLKTN